MKRNLLVYSFLGLCMLTVGCVPLPTNSVVHYGVRARVVDAESRMPVARRHVIVTVDNCRFDRKTNQNGEFEIAPEVHSYFTWLGGPMWMNATRARVEIEFDGYVPYHRVLVVRSESLDMALPPDKDRLSGRFIVLGDIEIKKRHVDGPEIGS
jgi:hypothetical protein